MKMDIKSNYTIAEAEANQTLTGATSDSDSVGVADGETSE